MIQSELIQELDRDMAALEKATEKVNKKEELLLQTQAVAGLGYWDWDIERGTLSWDIRIYEIFGVDPRTFPATYEGFLSFVHPDDRELVEKEVQLALDNKKPYEVIHRLIRPSDGSERTVREKAEVTFNDNDEPIRMLGTVIIINGRGGDARGKK